MNEGFEMSTKLEKIINGCIKILGTNRALSEYLGSNERTIYRWLSGETKPSADYVIKMYDLIIKNGHTI
jgi:hypothetical protein